MLSVNTYHELLIPWNYPWVTLKSISYEMDKENVEQTIWILNVDQESLLWWKKSVGISKEFTKVGIFLHFMDLYFRSPVILVHAEKTFKGIFTMWILY